MKEASSSEATLSEIAGLIAKDQKRKKSKKKRPKGRTTRLPTEIGGLQDELGMQSKGSKFDNKWYARESASKKYEESGSLSESFKDFRETEKIERIAKTGRKTGYGEFFSGMGLDNFGKIVETFFDKKATTDEINEARKSLGMPPLEDKMATEESTKPEPKVEEPTQAEKLQKPHQFEMQFEDQGKIDPMPFMDKLPPPPGSDAPAQPRRKKEKQYADPKTWFALEAAKQKYGADKEQGGGSLRGAFKEFRETEKTERLAKTGRKSAYGEFLKGAGFDNLGTVVEKFFDKRGSMEEIEEARKKLNLKPLQEQPETGKPLPKPIKERPPKVETETGSLIVTVQGKVDQIADDVTYIKERLAPKIIEAKGEKGTKREGTTQKVSFDPLAPEGEQFRKVDNDTGKVLATKVDNNFMKSASWKAANLSQRQGLGQPAPHLGDNFSLTKKPEPKSIMAESGTMSGTLSGAGAGDPTWDDPTEANKDEFAVDPVEKLRVDMNDNFTKVFEILDEQKEKLEEIEGGEGGEGSGILGVMKLAKNLGPMALTIGKALGPVAAVGLAAYAGYKIGSYLNEKLGLSEKINDLLEKVGVNDYDPNAGQKTAAELTDAANTREGSTLAAAGLKQVGIAQYETESGEVLSYSELNREQQKAVDLNKYSKTEGDLKKEAEDQIAAGTFVYTNADGKWETFEEKGFFESKNAYENRKKLAIDQYVKVRMAENEIDRKRINEEYAKKQAEATGDTTTPTPTAAGVVTPEVLLPEADKPPPGMGAATGAAAGAVAGAAAGAGMTTTTPTGAPSTPPPGTPPAPPPPISTASGGGTAGAGGGSSAPPKKIGASAGKAAMIKAMDKKGITDPTMRAAIMAQVAHESGGFRALSENLNYSAEGLNKIFPKYFKNAGRDAAEYARNPEKIANIVYGGRMGNGPPESGEGYLYRGRGFIQLTGKNNYKKYGVTNPDELLQPERAAEVAVDYMMGYRGDWNNIEAVTKYVNGGYHGLSDRASYFEGFKTDSEVSTPGAMPATSTATSESSAAPAPVAAPAAMTAAATTTTGAAPSSTGGGGGTAPAAMTAAATTPEVSAAPAAAPVPTITPMQTVSGDSLDTGTRQMAMAREITPQSTTVINNNPSGGSSGQPDLPSKPMTPAPIRSTDSTFNRAISKDFSHPSTFTSVALT